MFGLAALPALLAPGAVLLARLAQQRIVLPALATLVVYPLMAWLLLRGRRAAAAAAVLLWAASLSLSIIIVTRNDTASMERVVVNGSAYRDEMFDFIRSGAGRESDPSRFLPEHALHLLAFSLLSVGTGGLLGIALGAVLVAYMSFYVGALAAAGGAPGVALLFGWPPWAILRVAGFVLVGTCLAEPLLFAARRWLDGAVPRRAPYGPWSVAAAALLLGDVILKILFAPPWAVLLRPCLPP
jgi:hypothetical protein